MATQSYKPKTPLLQDVLSSALVRKEVEKKLLDRVVRAKSGCWEWTGCRAGKGKYGNMYINGFGYYRTHRISFFLFCDAPPNELLICHKCDNRICLNPTHLFSGTAFANRWDGTLKGRYGARPTHCKKGHEYTPENSRYKFDPRGYLERKCRECRRIYLRKNYCPIKQKAQKAAKRASNQVNMICGVRVASELAYKTHCPSGHPYDESNTAIRKDGARLCRECHRIQARKFRKIRSAMRPERGH